jgi:hypothetical protein
VTNIPQSSTKTCKSLSVWLASRNYSPELAQIYKENALAYCQNPDTKGLPLFTEDVIGGDYYYD